MSSLLAELLPIVIAAAVVPGLMVLVILVVQGKHGVAAGLAFVGGAIATRLLQGTLFGVLFRQESQEKQDATPAIQAMLLLVLAILLLVTAARLLLKGEDDDAPPPKWMESIGQIAPGRAFLIGMAAMAISAKQWVFTISAVQSIGYANPGVAVAASVFLLFVLIASLPLITPVLFMMLSPAKAATVLQQWRGWLDANFHTVKIAVSLIFGLLFLWKALSALLG